MTEEILKSIVAALMAGVVLGSTIAAVHFLAGGWVMRYDPKRGAYINCKWCGGRGCLQCQIEADKEYKRQFPNGPVPIASVPNTPEGIAKLRSAIGPEAIESAALEAAKRAAERPLNVLVAGLGSEELKRSMERRLVEEILLERLRAIGDQTQGG